MKNKKQLLQALKFFLFSISAGVIQISSYAILNIFIEPHWIKNIISIVLSVVWNFTLNRKYTFKSTASVPIAMAKILGFYLVFIPLSSWLGDILETIGVYDIIIELLTMLCNFVLEFLFYKFVVYRGKEDTIVKK